LALCQFLIFFNDITDVSIESTKIIKYADDTALPLVDKEIKEINAKLTGDMNAIAEWLDENELILNLSKGKTEALIFGTVLGALLKQTNH
jgi:hypothetical protein